MRIVNQIPSGKSLQPVRMHIEGGRVPVADEFREDVTCRWGEHDAVTAKPDGHVQTGMCWMLTQNRIFIRRHTVMPRPPPLELNIASVRQIVAHHRAHFSLKRIDIPVKIKAWWFVAQRAAHQEVVVGFGIVAEGHVARAI